jgi:hypothetical protein
MYAWGAGPSGRYTAGGSKRRSDPGTVDSSISWPGRARPGRAQAGSLRAPGGAPGAAEQHSGGPIGRRRCSPADCATCCAIGRCSVRSAALLGWGVNTVWLSSLDTVLLEVHIPTGRAAGCAPAGQGHRSPVQARLGDLFDRSFCCRRAVVVVRARQGVWFRRVPAGVRSSVSWLARCALARGPCFWPQERLA